MRWGLGSARAAGAAHAPWEGGGGRPSRFRDSRPCCVPYAGQYGMGMAMPHSNWPAPIAIRQGVTFVPAKVTLMHIFNHLLVLQREGLMNYKGIVSILLNEELAKHAQLLCIVGVVVRWDIAFGDCHHICNKQWWPLLDV